MLRFTCFSTILLTVHHWGDDIAGWKLAEQKKTTPAEHKFFSSPSRV